jgi:hypothetical protein
VRWERLSEVLSQLDEVRDRGERLVVERSRPRRKDQTAEDGAEGSEGSDGAGGAGGAGGSGAVEPGSGDGESAEGESALEGGLRPPS